MLTARRSTAAAAPAAAPVDDHRRCRPCRPRRAPGAIRARCSCPQCGPCNKHGALLAGDASSSPIQRILTYTLRVLAEKVAIGGGKHEGAALELLIPTLVETLQSPAAAARLVPALLELHAAATCHGSASTPPLLLFLTLRLLSATFSGVSALPASAVALLSTEVARAEAAQGSATIGTVASLVSSGAEGLIALAQAGVAWRRVQGFVEAAQTPGGCNELHSPPVAVRQRRCSWPYHGCSS